MSAIRSDSAAVQPTLLLVDDSATIQRVIALTFVEEGIRVVAASDGTQALKMLDQDPPDIVIADVGMAGTNGYDVARYVKNTPRLAHIPVLLSSGGYSPVDRVRATEVGCAGVLTKPFEPQRVIDRVKEFLKATRSTSNDTFVTKSSPAPWDSIGELPLGGQHKSEASGDIDDYFDRLDKAFALLSDASTGSEPVKGAAHWSGRPLAPETTSADDSQNSSGFESEADPKAARPPAPQVIEPLLPPPPEWTFVPASVPPPSPSSRSGLPSLADAFAAILAAEQSAAMGTAEWPGSSASVARIPTSEIVEQVTRRVIERMSEQVVRERVDATVAATAERLVRDEIDRIKAHIV